MNPTEQYPHGRAVYTWMQSKTGYEQKIDPYTGHTVGGDDPWAHITPQFAVSELDIMCVGRCLASARQKVGLLCYGRTKKQTAFGKVTI